MLKKLIMVFLFFVFGAFFGYLFGFQTGVQKGLETTESVIELMSGFAEEFLSLSDQL